MTVIIAYLLYTMYEADYLIRQKGDFYTDLGLSPDVDEKRIKSRFRRLAAVHHPDKIVSDNPAELRAAEAYFVSLKIAQDTLLDPVKRFAYERFGPDMLTWQHCSSIREYLVRGLQVSSGPLYGGSLFFLIMLGFTGYLQWGRFWRYLTFCTLFVLELHTLTRPYYPPLLTKAMNPVFSSLTKHTPLLPFQLLILARKATFTFFIALSQIGSLYPTPPSASGISASTHDEQQMTRLENIAKGTEAEADRLLAMDMSPFAADEQGTKELRGRVREWLVNNTIRSDPEVRDAMGRVLGRRRPGAPVGART